MTTGEYLPARRLFASPLTLLNNFRAEPAEFHRAKGACFAPLLPRKNKQLSSNKGAAREQPLVG